MQYLVKEEWLELKYERGKGAWTYHLLIPNTRHIVGKWGKLKVSGFIDNYPIEQKNLFTIAGQDKMLSVNEQIRKVIGKTGGDKVKVTLFLSTPEKKVSDTEILETLETSGVLSVFNALPKDERTAILKNIQSLPSEEQMVKALVKLIDDLNQ